MRQVFFDALSEQYGLNNPQQIKAYPFDVLKFFKSFEDVASKVISVVSSKADATIDAFVNTSVLDENIVEDFMADIENLGVFITDDMKKLLSSYSESRNADDINAFKVAVHKDLDDELDEMLTDINELMVSTTLSGELASYQFDNGSKIKTIIIIDDLIELFWSIFKSSEIILEGQEAGEFISAGYKFCSEKSADVYKDMETCIAITTLSDSYGIGTEYEDELDQMFYDEILNLVSPLLDGDF